MIEISNLSKRYGKQVVVDDLSLKISKGETFGFLGQNGAGKTTTIKMIVGLTRPDEGKITIGGKLVDDISARRKIGFMPEAPYFYERLTGMEFMKFCGDLFGENNRSESEYEDILKMTGIFDAKDKAIGKYSKGMKQRLGFAQTLVNDPDYIFLDEPLDGLDPLGRKEIKKIIKTLQGNGKTIFFNSHILYDTEELCDRIGIIHKGRLLYAGAVKEFCQGKPLEEKFVELVEMQQ
ncbi:MAG: ABC transporter ATP-binding protein [Patescibacteria group bacterium]|nr:ABC transporter ATP-binding protein [Patescibacteria group bacterium]MDE2015313.1 ABC transporter ATP-binding protein [Patescibacteria group bacterium]MDE2227118.1 ABC transporter ATP-binding protein [Patescibacteria group bacterium]